jgi:UDP-N-acetylglucosamine 2-epimerase (non-hydrolysing)/GDP/UDP-N,N'-diacetylbacillosamine 2-epimerase (hydrolysing)
VTGTRADYGLLFWLLHDLRREPSVDLQLVATGMHLSPEFGMTVRAIEKDGFEVTERVEMLLSSDTPAGIAKSVGLGVIGFADTFARLQPDLVVVLGDRFEILAAVQAALVAKIPVAHIHGGEATKGLIDDPIRHAITKMAHFHFVSAEPFRKRVIQMGEHPERVFLVGAPGLDHLKRSTLLTRAEFEQSMGFDLRRPTLLVTQHPITLAAGDPARATRELLAALDEFPDALIIFTRANADTDGRVINEMTEAYVQQHLGRAHVFTSLGQQRYLSALHHVDAVVGNSSSGIIEAPAVPVPTVNIGDRQGGRLSADSVINCEEERASIAAAIRKALSASFVESLRNVRSPFGTGDASRQIAEHVTSVSLKGVLKKGFYDLIKHEGWA